jgi:hypothetical protein
MACFDIVEPSFLMICVHHTVAKYAGLFFFIAGARVSLERD